MLEQLGHDSANNPTNAVEFLARKEMTYELLSEFIDIKELPEIVKEQVEINSKYKIFINREKLQIEKFKKLEELEIPENIEYEKIQGISNIAVSSLSYAKPKTVGQAIRISGVTHNDIGILISIIKTAQK